ncbi:helix-turn-helix transcriptional regulator [Ahrensia sp. 13_GOM-1096m]|uniref:ArsR/SmtB family transcription factor n=1 Tax=Ahrensia sp. 13_GOM-1096m TaxID=1380380 RepID=UPI00047DA88E|nr:metalloregulator ArsR/SmtB family transcription factor [Ahrensia sp. 13_GOM-1096m]
MDEKKAILSFSALSNETRLRILKQLVAAGSDGMSAGDIAQKVGATPSRASFHLSALDETGMVTSTRQSRQITYHVNFEAVGGLIKYLMEDCCQNNEVVRACCSTGC